MQGDDVVVDLAAIAVALGMTENSTYQKLRGHCLSPSRGGRPKACRRARSREDEKLSHTAFLERLLDVEVAATEVRVTPAWNGFANLPAPWRLSTRLRRATLRHRQLVNELGTLGSSKTHPCVVIGPPGVARRCSPSRSAAPRSTPATAPTTPPPPTSPPAVTEPRSKGDGRPRCGSSPAALLIIDEVGYLPSRPKQPRALFQVITQRYLKSSTVLTTNLVVGSWERSR